MPEGGETGGGEIRFRSLQGVPPPRMERAWPGDPRGYTFASPSPDRTGGQIKDRQPGADVDRTPGKSASPDLYDSTESQPTDRNVEPTGLLDRPAPERD